MSSVINVVECGRNIVESWAVYLMMDDICCVYKNQLGGPVTIHYSEISMDTHDVGSLGCINTK